MVAKTELSQPLERLREKVWPYTAYEANSRTRNWEYPFVMSQIENYKTIHTIPSFTALSIIEMGAANSCLQFYYAKKGVSYTCVDETEQAYNKSLGRTMGIDIQRIIGKFEDVRVPRQFDLFISVSVMEHTRPGNEKRILTNVARALKPGGRAIFTLDWFFDYTVGEPCVWGHNPNCKHLVDLSNELGLTLVLGEKKYLSGFAEFNEREMKQDAFVLKVCNRGVWLTSLAFVLEKSEGQFSPTR